MALLLHVPGSVAGYELISMADSVKWGALEATLNAGAIVLAVRLAERAAPAPAPPAPAEP